MFGTTVVFILLLSLLVTSLYADMLIEHLWFQRLSSSNFLWTSCSQSRCADRVSICQSNV